MKRNITIITITILLALAIVNFLASRHFVRLDLTRNHDYTLAPASKKTLRNLKDVVTLRLYFTKDLPPQLLMLRRLVDDTVGEFRSFGGQNIRVEYVDPAEDESTEREAMIAGITPVQLNVQGQDKISVAKVYLGAELLQGDKKEVIPVIAYPQNLEYDLISRIVKLTSKTLPSIAWWGPKAGDPSIAAQPGKGFRLFRHELEQRYIIKEVNPDTPLLDPAQQSTLLLLTPKDLTADQRFVIDQFLMQGGQVIALIDTAIVTTTMQATPQVSGLEDMLNSYGIGVESDLIMDRANANAVFSGGVVNYQIPYPFWVKLLPRDMDAQNRIVSGLDGVVMPWTSSLSVAKSAPEGVTLKTLATSTEFAKVQKFSDGYHLDPEAAGGALQQANGGKAYDVIAMASGKFPSYFATGKEAAPKGLTAQAATKEGKLLVIGTSRVVQDQFVNQFPQDAALVENAVDILAFGDQLIGIRSRGQLAYPIDEMSPLAEQIVRYANMVGGVILVVALAGLVFSYRRGRRKSLQLTFRRT